MRHSFDLNDIRLFVAASQSRSMSAAARDLQMPTSSVSRGVARLEKYMGIQLVNREPHGIALTEAGHSYLEFCIEALDTLGEGGQQLVRSRVLPEGLLRIACPALMSQEIFAPLVSEFLRTHSRLQLEVVPYHPGGRDALPSPVDLAFELKPPANPRTLVRRFPAVRRGIYASRSFLARTETVSRPEDLLQRDCIGSRAAAHLSQWALQGPAGGRVVEPAFKLFAAEPTLLRAMVRDGLGISILPVWMALEPGLRAEIVRVLPEWEPTPVPLFACVPFGSTLLPGTQALLEFFSRHLGTATDPRVVGLGANAPAHCFCLEAE